MEKSHAWIKKYHEAFSSLKKGKRLPITHDFVKERVGTYASYKSHKNVSRTFMDGMQGMAYRPLYSRILLFQAFPYWQVELRSYSWVY